MLLNLNCWKILNYFVIVHGRFMEQRKRNAGRKLVETEWHRFEWPAIRVHFDLNLKYRFATFYIDVNFARTQSMFCLSYLCFV